MESILKQAHSNLVLYVVDSASSDETLQLVSAYADARVRIIRDSRNVGIAEGNNIGIRAAFCDGCASVLLINNDTVFDSDLISKLACGLNQYACDMIVPKILYFDAADKVWSAGGAFSPWRGRPRHIGYGKKDDGRFDQARKVQFGPMCCMLIRGSVFERIGLMDPKYFVYFDDADFCLRAHRARITLMYTPAACLYHKVSSLIGHRSDLALRFITRNHVYYVLKNFQSLAVFYYLPVCQAHIFVRCWFAKRKLRAFFLAQRAFFEGLSLSRGQADSSALVF
jgi:hypothetical protein